MKPIVSTFELVDRAASELKRIGFELRHVSMRSEACYYALPGKQSLMRLATHSKKKDPIGMSKVVSKLTFNGGAGGVEVNSGHMKLHPDKFRQMLAAAIGVYMLNMEK